MNVVWDVLLAEQPTVPFLSSRRREIFPAAEHQGAIRPRIWIERSDGDEPSRMDEAAYLEEDPYIFMLGSDSDKEMIAMLEEGARRQGLSRVVKPPTAMPLKNWETLSGPSATKEEMITKLGLVPRPFVSI